MPTPDSTLARAVRGLRRRARGAGRSPQVETGIKTGVDAEIVRRVHRLVVAKQPRRARALIEDVAARPGTEPTTDTCRGLLAVNGSMREVAWTLLTRHDPALVVRLVPLALVRAGVEAHAEAIADLVRDAVADPAWSPSPDDSLRIARAFLLRGDPDTARAVLHRPGADLGRQRPRRFAALDAWLRSAGSPPSGGGAAAAASFVLWDHADLDPARTPRALGPYVDSLAVLAALSRAGATLDSPDPEVQAVCDDLAGRPGAERPGARAASLHVVSRQASHLSRVPDGSWAVVSGPLVRRSADVGARFPFDARIRPVFLGVHVDAAELARPGAVDHLRERGPVGCADWNSVHLLSAAEVPAFFSGPLLGAPAPAPGRDPVAAEAPDREVRVSWSDPATPTRSFGQNLAAAVAAAGSLAALAGRAQVRTRDDDVFWAARSWGCAVDRRAGRRGKAHDAEAGMPDARLEALAAANAELLHIVFTAVLAGEDEQQVRARWRDACAAAVAETARRAETLPPLEPLSWSLDDLCAEVRSREVLRERRVGGDGSEVLVEVSLDARLKHQLGVVLDSMVCHTAQPVRVHVLAREHDERDFDRMARLFPEVTFVWLPTDTATYGQIGGLLKHITVASMDRLLLPRLLPEVPRIIHHDLDAVTRGDLAELFALDLHGAPLAARDQLQPHGGSLYRSFAAEAERRFRDRPEVGSELLLRMARLHPFDHATFNSGVMVMDLERMRADDFLGTFLPWVPRYGLNDQVLLNAYAGSTRAPLPYEWNHFPRIEAPLPDPKVVHWIGSQKPWAVQRTAGRQHWVAAEASFAERVRRA